jgi:hypothetical protein
MSGFATPTRADHQKFCLTEGWAQVRTARGRKGAHHLTFELTLPDGRILRTRISHPPDRSDYGPALWSHVRRDQLDVSDEELWACVDRGEKPARGRPSLPEAEPIPLDIVRPLRDRVGVPETEIAAMSRQEAIDRLHRYWTTGE